MHLVVIFQKPQSPIWFISTASCDLWPRFVGLQKMSKSTQVVTGGLCCFPSVRGPAIWWRTQISGPPGVGTPREGTTGAPRKKKPCLPLPARHFFSNAAGVGRAQKNLSHGQRGARLFNFFVFYFFLHRPPSFSLSRTHRALWSVEDKRILD